MKQRQLLLGTLSALVAVSLSIAERAGAQVVSREAVPHATQKPVVHQAASVDSLVECSPVAAPVRKKPVVRHRKPAAAAPGKVVRKPAPRKSVARAPGAVVRRVKRVKPRHVNPAPAQTTTIVMCRPVRPLTPLAQGTPVEESVIPVPRLASATQPDTVADIAPPSFVSTAPGAPTVSNAGGRSWLPFSVIPAVFIPFIHSGGTRHGSTTPGDPGTPPDSVPVKPPVDTVPVLPPGTPPPPTTVPEPGSLVMLASGLLGIAGVSARQRKRKR